VTAVFRIPLGVDRPNFARAAELAAIEATYPIGL
jgi:hypothetical protein